MAVEFVSQNEFQIQNERELEKWINNEVLGEGFEVGDLQFVFCDDEYLHAINLEFLNHDTYTDVIGFDYTMGRAIAGEIYISTERVKENALKFDVTAELELYRVMIHGVLHFCGYKDDTDENKDKMKSREDMAVDNLLNN